MFPGSDHVNVTMDPLRLAAQIVSGIGFLGAGVILRRDNHSISGLTTAAIIWGAAGIGIAVGSGFYTEAIAGVILLMISVEFVPFILKTIGPKQLRQKEIMLKLMIHNKDDIAKVMSQIKKDEITVKNIRIKDLEENRHSVYLRITVDKKRKTTDVYYTVSNFPEIAKVEIENL
jgi:putative Mg2+ transporter-C (MgtC) family protein